MPKDKLTFTTQTPENPGARRPAGGFFSSMPRRPDTVIPTATTRQDVAVMKGPLGIFDKFLLDRHTHRELRKIVGELVINVYEAEKQQVLFKLMLEGGEEKKRLFAESMRRGNEIEKQIAVMSTDLEEELIEFALSRGLEGHEQKKKRVARLEEARSSGRIDEESYHSELEAVTFWAQTFRADLDGKVMLMIRGHCQQIEKTLTNFQERAINVTAVG